MANPIEELASLKLEEWAARERAKNKGRKTGTFYIRKLKDNIPLQVFNNILAEQRGEHPKPIPYNPRKVN
jgi:hypothetical protein